MIEFNIFHILGFIAAIIAILVNVFSKKWEFLDLYMKDEAAYESSCDELYKALEKKDDSFGPALYKYFSAKLTLEGVFSWSSWGRSVRMFNRFQSFALALSIFLLIFLATYLALSLGLASETGLSIMLKLVIILSLLLTTTVICLGIYIRRCKIILDKRRKYNLFSPEKDMLVRDRKVPEYGLVLLSRLASKESPYKVMHP